jgi:hypothetical protein
MSRKKLKEMLKREMDTRINSYSSKPSKSDDEKPLINTTTKSELLGKPKEEVRFDLPTKKSSKAPKEEPVKEEPVKEEPVKEEPVKEERPQSRLEETRPREDARGRSEESRGREDARKIDKRYSFDSDYSDEDSYSSEEESNEEKKYSEDESEESEDDYKNYKRPSKGDEELSEKQKYGPNYGRKPQKEATDEELLERQKYGQMYERKQQDREREYKKYQDTRGREEKKSSTKNKKREDSLERPREDTRGRSNEARPREDTRGRSEESRDERRNVSTANPFEDIHKKAFLQLIKSNDVNNISGDCVDELKDILNNFLIYMFEQFAEPDRTVMAEAADVKTYMSFYLEDEDKELPQELSIPSRDVERGIMIICERFRIKIRKDVVYLVHMFAECILLKVIKGALMINDLGKAKRLSGKEIRTAYKIYMM